MNHIRATGHNNLGVYFHFSQLDDALKKAKYHYLKAAEFIEQDYIDATPFDNLAVHLFNVQSNSRMSKKQSVGQLYQIKTRATVFLQI